MLRTSIQILAIALFCACQPHDEALRRIEQPLQVSLKSAEGCWRFDLGANHFRDRVPTGGIIFLDSVKDSIYAYDAFVLHVAVVPSDSSVAGRTRLSGWGADSADVQLLHLWLGDGFTGASFRLRQYGDTLKGSVRGYTDVSPSFSREHGVRALRALCPTG